MFTASLLGMAILAPQQGPGLRAIVDQIPVNFGAAVSSDLVNSNVESGKYRQAIVKNFNLLEPENDLKPPALWQSPKRIDFTKSDYLINWAKSNNMKVRGHVLVYANDDGYTIPGWLLAMENQLSQKQALLMLKQYIYTVVGRYKGKISMWDVINEAIDDSANGRPYNLRNSFWYRKLGVDFLYYAFLYAHEADPACKLYYNEYNVEAGGQKADNMMNLIAHLRQKGAPINGVGLQFHRSVSDVPSPGDGYYRMIQRIRDQGLTFMITELDVSMPVVNLPSNDPNFGAIPLDSNDLTRQAQSYAAHIRMAMSFPNCEGIQLWGVTDKHSWIPWFTGGGRGAALLLDKDYLPKPAYTSVENIFNSYLPPLSVNQNQVFRR
jgi:endo-1,4-beta-xylanase